MIAEAEHVAKLALGEKREDLRHLPIVAIDPVDARDHDDAVWAAPDDDPANAGGWQAIVAIADVSFYVRPGSAIDRQARKRGNSVYFPDRVVPMLRRCCRRTSAR
ncbi:MAG: RNB domain-containing ribonuclease [Sphingomonas fennica]